MYSPDAGLFMFFFPREPYQEKASELLWVVGILIHWFFLRNYFTFWGFYDYKSLCLVLT